MSQYPSHPRRPITRRTITAGAAWATSVVAVARLAPSAAASECEPLTVSFGPGSCTTTNDDGSVTYVVTFCATTTCLPASATVAIVAIQSLGPALIPVAQVLAGVNRDCATSTFTDPTGGSAVKVTFVELPSGATHQVTLTKPTETCP